MKTMKNKVLRISSDTISVKEFKDSGKISIEGYANTNTKDRVGDVITTEAWSKGGLDNYLKNPVVLAFHDYTKPIGQVVDYDISHKGLHVVAEISKAAGDVYNLIKEGILKAFSVGFTVKDADYNEESDIFIIKDLELLELSVVSVPANAETIFSVKKSFKNKDDFVEYKNLYSKEEVVSDAQQQAPQEETKTVDKEKISLTPEELEAEKQKAIESAMAKAKAEAEAEAARKKEIEELATYAGTTGAERLIQELQKKLDEQDLEMKKALQGLESEVKEKAAELEAFNKSKMEFTSNGDRKKISEKQIDDMILTSIITGKPVDKLKMFEAVTKAAGYDTYSEHLGDGSTGVADRAGWEMLFSTRMYEEIMDKTIIEPLFTNRLTMNSRAMTFPWNQEAGYASWVDDDNYKSGTGFGDTGTSTGTAETHLFKDNTIVAHKLATKEFIGYEEEEDTIIPLLPLIRDAVIRRMVRSTDTELLRANAGANSGSGTALIDGVAQIAVDNSVTHTVSGAFGDAVTIADLQSTRRKLGRFGLSPGELIYVVSETIMYDLMEDPDFRTMDMVGDRASILRGQIGMVNGSPVIVSDGFITNAASTVQAIAINPRNYLFGELRGLTVERDRDIINQKNVIVASRRFGFKEIVPGATSGQHACAALVQPA